jgi:hypothetical protein
LLRISTFLLACLLATRPAQAGAKDSVASMEKAAKKACISGDYAKGTELLSELYVETNDITHVFNQGRCFEQNGRYEEAILRFREYARKLKQAGHPLDAEVERHIADCQALLGRSAEPPAPAPSTIGSTSTSPRASTPVAPPARPLPEATPAESEVAPTGRSRTPDLTQAASPAAAPGIGLRVTGIVTFGLGVAGVAAGVILNVKANDLADEVQASSTSYRRGKEDTRASYETYGWVAYSAGAACMAAGAILYYLGHRQGRNSYLAFVPTTTGGAPGAVVQGGF